MSERFYTLCFLLLLTGTAWAVTSGGAGSDNFDVGPADGHSWHGQKYISAAGTVDIASGGQGTRVKVDAAGITWTGAHLVGSTLTDESLIFANPGHYKVSWHVAIDGTQGKRYLFDVVTDTNADPSDGSPVTVPGCSNDFSVQANTHAPGSACCFLTVAGGEYIYLAVTEPGGAGGTNFDIDHGGLSIHQL